MKRTLLTILLVACSKSSPSPTTPANPAPVDTAPTAPVETQPTESQPAPVAPPLEAKVELTPTSKSKSKATGTITFKAVDGGVELTATLEGLTAGKEHAWHIHEKGDCSAPDELGQRCSSRSSRMEP